jgi:hypothetical protein
VRTLVYKRTHKGDPDKKGRFGIKDCLGGIRSWDFEAVIGIGGIGSRAIAQGINGKVNWIGIDPQKGAIHGRGPLVTFKHFVLYDGKGVKVGKQARTLAQRMYSPNAPRFLFNDNFKKVEQAEIDRLLKMAKTAKPSVGTPRRQSRAKSACGPKHC